MDAENNREKRSPAEFMSCILNAAANTEKMSMTGLQPKKSSEKNLSRSQRKRGPPKEFATRLIDFALRINCLASGTGETTDSAAGRPGFPEQPRAERSFRFGGGGPVRPFTYPAKGQLDGETRVPMVTKIISLTVNASETLMPDTINAGTGLIEEGTLLSKCERFESEPWTSFFYMAGDIIRELRKANRSVSLQGVFTRAEEHLVRIQACGLLSQGNATRVN